MAKMTTEEFIAKAREVHGNKYDYSKVEYVDSKTKVCIICPKHGDFWQAPNKHLAGQSCPECSRPNHNTDTESFITRARKIYGDKYSYEKTVYRGMNHEVVVTCPEHGDFKIKAANFLKGFACKKCKNTNFCNSKEEFIAKAKKIHGDKYDYSKVIFNGMTQKVVITCPIHGDFEQTPSRHLNGRGCRKCGGTALKTEEEFLKEVKNIFGDRYDFSESKYVNSKTKVKVICHELDEFGEEHGAFYAMPSNLLKGKGCPKCLGRGMTKEQFIRKAHEVHGDKYDYSRVNWDNVSNIQKDLVCIICPEHGPFWQRPYSHINGAGCPNCAGNVKMSSEEFIARAKKIHGDKYDYSKVVYKNNRTEVCIKCPEHGEFWQLPHLHLSGAGCPNCHGLRKDYKFNLLQEFKDEYAFREFLANNDINILQVILRNVEPKYEPLKKDIEKALANAESMNPIRALEEKYSSNNSNDEEPIDNEPTTREEPIQNTPDLDDDDAISEFINTMSGNNEQEEKEEPTIEEITRNREEELKVINRIEHMLTPEDREYIMNKFLNDKRRDWMANREQNK